MLLRVWIIIWPSLIVLEIFFSSFISCKTCSHSFGTEKRIIFELLLFTNISAWQWSQETHKIPRKVILGGNKDRIGSTSSWRLVWLWKRSLFKRSYGKINCCMPQLFSEKGLLRRDVIRANCWVEYLHWIASVCNWGVLFYCTVLLLYYSRCSIDKKRLWKPREKKKRVNMSNKKWKNRVIHNSFRRARWLNKDVKHNKVNVSRVHPVCEILYWSKKSKVCQNCMWMSFHSKMRNWRLTKSQLCKTARKKSKAISSLMLGSNFLTIQ